MTRKPPARARAREWLPRLAAVRIREDRRASLPLLSLFLSDELDDDERGDVASTLAALEDVRCAAALERAILDPARPLDVRRLAIEVLSAIPCDAPPRDRVAEWVRARDPVVRAFGTRFLDVPEADEIAAAARDPEPLVRWAAVDTLASITRTPPLVQAIRAALCDDDPIVRETACRAALFDEPLEATWELLRALTDGVASVRGAACDALEDYPRVSVLLALADAATDGADGSAPRAALAAVVARVRNAFEEASPRACRRLERWIAPAAWLVDPPHTSPAPEVSTSASEAEADAAAAPQRAPAGPGNGNEEPDDDEDDDDDEQAGRPVDLRRASRILLDPDGPPSLQRRLLLRRSWQRTGAAGLDVARACATSENWSLRQASAYAFGDLGATDDLLALAYDPQPVVRRSALEVLRDNGDRRGIDAARATLDDPWARPTAGDEALALIGSVAGEEEAERVVLDELSRPDDRDGLFLGAIHLAFHLRSELAVPALLAIVNAPVHASVLQHVAALEALRSLGHPRSRIDLHHLEGVDHLDVQRELGEWDWHGARYG